MAALLVFLHHLSIYSGQALPFAGAAGGFLGVQLFFLISGYLIIQSASRYPPGTYLKHRVLRIVPCYWVVLVPLLFAYGKLPLRTLWPDGGHVVSSMLMLSLWVPEALYHYDMVRVSWTLSIELAWYAVAFLMVRFLALRDPRTWRWLVPLAVLGSTGWNLLAMRGGLDAAFAGLYGLSLPLDERFRDTFILGNFPGALVFFVAGAALWRFESTLSGLRTRLLAAAVLVLVAPAPWWTTLAGSASPLYAPGLAALFLLVLRARGAWLAPLALLGKVSYPVYLLHVPVLLALFHHAQLPAIGGTALAVAATLALSAALHAGVERPFMRLARA